MWVKGRMNSGINLLIRCGAVAGKRPIHDTLFTIDDPRLSTDFQAIKALKNRYKAGRNILFPLFVFCKMQLIS